MTTLDEIQRGYCDNDYPYVPGVNCIGCGKFVGRDGWIGVGHCEMSSQIAYVEGECARCVRRSAEFYGLAPVEDGEG